MGDKLLISLRIEETSACRAVGEVDRLLADQEAEDYIEAQNQPLIQGECIEMHSKTIEILDNNFHFYPFSAHSPPWTG